MGASSKSGAARKMRPPPPSPSTQHRKPAKKSSAPSRNDSGARRTATARVATTHDRTAPTGSTLASSPAPQNSPLTLQEQEAAVAQVRASLPSPANREELRKDPIYRVMHTMPRSDVLEVVRSRFAAPHCIRAAAYFDQSYMANPLRRLRLQLGCDGPTGMHLFFSRIAVHRHTLRVLDLSRNRLAAEDVVLLCNLLGLGADGAVSGATIALNDGTDAARGALPPTANAAAVPATVAAASPGASPVHSSLEMVDLSYNTKIGNDGALHVLRALRRCSTIRAVLLRSVGMDDDGAMAVSATLRQWPVPTAASEEEAATLNALRPQTASATKFFVSLNDNFIGARGTYVLGKGLPDHVSLTVVKQRPPFAKEKKG